MPTQMGTLEELPSDYVHELAALGAMPLWPSLRAALPYHKPNRATRPFAWRYSELRSYLLRAGELTPIEKAERRVLVLANPGHGLDNMKASAAIYLGMQLLMPGEWAPSHRHTPNAVRMVVEREREIRAFTAREYWTLAAVLLTADGTAFTADLARIDGKPVDIADGETAERHAAAIRDLRPVVGDRCGK